MMQYMADFINNRELIGICRRACNCVDKRLMDHGVRVSYIVSRLLRRRSGLDAVRLRNICVIAALHDIGAYKTEEINRMLQFESEDVWDHSIYGYLFIKYFSPLSELAVAVLYHHTPWSMLKEISSVSEKSKELAQLIQIADRLDICINREKRSYEEFLQIITGECESRYERKIVEAMLSEKFTAFTAEEIENDAVFCRMESEVPFNQEEIKAYLEMIIYSIDFRSRHTVTHTMTTTSISYEIARRMNLDAFYCNQIVCGALLHDLGKIGIPTEILEYPGKLSPQAMKIMRTHVQITDEIFGEGIPPVIRQIALRHHERLDGSGYPCGLAGEELSIGERIVAVADVVSALAGTRSYKDAYGKERVVSIMSEMRHSGIMDADIVDCMISGYDEIMDITAVRCRPVLDTYQALREEYTAMMERYTGGGEDRREVAVYDA